MVADFDGGRRYRLCGTACRGRDCVATGADLVSSSGIGNGRRGVEQLAVEPATTDRSSEAEVRRGGGHCRVVNGQFLHTVHTQFAYGAVE